LWIFVSITNVGQIDIIWRVVDGYSTRQIYELSLPEIEKIAARSRYQNIEYANGDLLRTCTDKIASQDKYKGFESNMIKWFAPILVVSRDGENGGIDCYLRTKN
jgi:hypothetical protein